MAQNKMDSNIIKSDIKKLSANTLINHGVIQAAPDGGIICPNCGNGAGEDGTGIKPYEKDGMTKYHCFKCGANFDNLSLIGTHLNLDMRRDFPKVLEYGATLLGTAATLPVTFPKKNFVEISNTKENFVAEDYSEFLAAAAANIEKLPESARRGLTLETLKHFNCGFVADWQHPKSQNSPKTARLIIPTSERHYLARAIDPKIDKKYQKMHCGRKEFFNRDALKADSPVVVVEGEIDAMSIWQAVQIPVIAVGGVTSYKLLTDYLGSNSPKNLQFVVMFDNDDAGQMNAKKLVDSLHAFGYHAVNRVLNDKEKFDFNDFLNQNREEFTMAVNEIYTDAKEELVEITEEMKDKLAFEREIKDFEEMTDSKVNPEVLPNIKSAFDFRKDFVAGKITLEKIMSDEFTNFIGYAPFYKLMSKGAIIEQIKKAKNLAAAEIKNKPESEITSEVREIAEFDNREYIKAIYSKEKGKVATAHEKYNKIIRKKLRKKEREEYKLAEKLAEEQRIKETFARAYSELNYLYTLPQTAERDAKIVNVIRSSLEWHKNEYVKPTNDNFALIFNYDPFVRDLVGYNEFSKMDTLLKQVDWRKDNCIGECWTESDDSHLRIYLGLTYKDIDSGYRRYYSFFDKLVAKNAFHPIKQMLENLPKWDGVTRAEKVFVDFLRVEDTPYAREVTFKTLLAAIARVYNPGCEWQYVPVLKGNQGIGKGYVLKKLGDPYYMELVDSVESSHAIDAIQKGWLIEIPELQSFGRASVNKIKAFVSAREDTHRFAYARKATTVKRSNIFFGTTNDSHPLEDNTGARRFLMLECGSAYCDFVKGLTDDYVKQIWSEMMYKYRQIFKDGFDDSKLILSDESKKVAAELAGQFTKDDGMTGEILAFLDTPIPHQAVWRLLSKEERRKFFVEKHITITVDELLARQQVRRRSVEMEELKDIIDNADFDKSIRKTGEETALMFYGCELRTSICAAEIYNECFGNDRRKSMTRISEVLANLPEEWQRDKRRKSKEYGDQRNIFSRTVEPMSDAEETPNEKVAANDNKKDNNIEKKVAETLMSATLFDESYFDKYEDFAVYLSSVTTKLDNLNARGFLH